VVFQEDTDRIYRKWESRLRDLYNSHIDKANVGISHCWHLADWQFLMEKCGFHEDDSFTREEGNLCYYLAKFEVIDYAKEKDKYEGLDWLSFLEAFGHIVRFKEMPLVASLKKQGLEGVVGLVEQLAAESRSWNDYMAEQGLSGDQDPFHVELDQLFALLFHFVDKHKLLGPHLNSHRTSRPGSRGSRGSSRGGSRPATDPRK